jgi:hypothetical protein
MTALHRFGKAGFFDNVHKMPSLRTRYKIQPPDFNKVWHVHPDFLRQHWPVALA